MAATLGDPLVLDAAEVEDIVDGGALGALVMEAADEEAVAEGAPVEMDGDGVTRVAVMERGTTRQGADGALRRRCPAARDGGLRALAFAFFQHNAARTNDAGACRRAAVDPVIVAKPGVAAVDDTEDAAGMLVVGDGV